MASLLESIKRKSQIVVTQINAIIAAINDKLDMKTGGTIEGNITVEGDVTVTGKINASIEGVAESAISAEKLSNARTVALTGDVTGSATFDGSEDISISVTVADDSHSHTIDNIDNLETIIDNLETILDDKAPLASPVFTGTPTAPTAANTTNTTQIATTAFVQSVVDSKIAAADAMIYKGTIGTNGTVTALPNTHKTGWTYKVITAGTYAGMKCNVGDMIICLTDGTTANNAHWTVVEGNIDGAVTGPASSVASNVAIFDGATGKVIKDSGFSIASSVPANAKFTDTNNKVSQEVSIASGEYALLAMFDAAATTTKTNGARFASGVTLNPATKTITATTFKGALDGNATTATTASSCSGNAATATKLAASKNISLTGDVSGSAGFDGSAAASIATTLANSGVTAGSYGPSANASPAFGGTFSVPYITVDAKGRATASSTKTITIPALDMSKATAGTLAVARGGTGLTSSPSMLINLASASAANVLAASPRPGVTGVLPVANGGTGSSTKNFVDLSTEQEVAGTKKFTNVVVAGTLTIPGGGSIWIE